MAVQIKDDQILEVESDTTFLVHSQSTPDKSYTVNLEHYTCTCPSFPLIPFCKHICAVELKFPDVVVPRTLPVASQPWDSDIDTSSSTHLMPTLTTSGSDKPHNSSDVQDTARDAALLQRLSSKIDVLRRQKLTLPWDLYQHLERLSDALSDITNGAEILPPQGKKIAPNRGTWSETAEVMGVVAEGARKRKHANAHSGSQASGKYAKPDARTQKKSKVISESNEVPAPPPSGADTIIAERASPDAITKLLDVIQQYNRAYPPHVPLTTADFYRNTSRPHSTI
ncbi:unnamed protein product [Mycena citricolor]|uniref:SWIM-type domain-containing protein n=1 Tax=Mycena citricolor TaxID=2018698 RepID=A0AAD2I0H4_9AGAR|nr:unnamed protein product [Mycena citricolor]